MLCDCVCHYQCGVCPCITSLTTNVAATKCVSATNVVCREESLCHYQCVIVFQVCMSN